MGVNKEFLKILDCYIHGDEYRLPEGFSEFHELLVLSAEQKLIPAVYDKIGCLEEQSFRQQAMREIFSQVQRTEDFLRVYEKLCDRGLKPVVVKGIVLRNLYMKPDYRVSADEDVLIRKDEFPIWEEVLSQEGFVRRHQILEDKKLPYEISYVNLVTGVHIELHFQLFPERSEAYGHLNQEFLNVFDKITCEVINGRKVWTLLPTEHLYYLICHSLKHFLHSGVGIRQVCDMIVFAEHYGKEIDWSYLEKKMARLRIDEYWNGIVDIGRRYLGFDVEKACYPVHMLEYDTDCQNMLYDMLTGGVYGGNTMERLHSSNVTLAAREKGVKGLGTGIRKSLFPNVEYMKKRYPKLMKYDVFLPIAWIVRITEYALETGRTKNGLSGSIKIGKKRVELLKQYHLID